MKITAYTDETFQTPLSGAAYSLMVDPEKYTLTDDLHFEAVIDCTGAIDPERMDMSAEIVALKTVLYSYDGNLHRPNFVKLEWGPDFIFKGLITSFDVSYTLFEPHGSPLRAKILMSFCSLTSETTEKCIASRAPDDKANEGISIKNAGIVLLNAYIEILFERLMLTTGKNFISETHQLNAVHYLQYLATGLSNTEEHLLPLNKVLCGVPLTETIPAGIDISEHDILLMEGLLKAFISYWPAIGNSSIEGCRDNWFIRDGQLVELEDKWELTVAKKSYDILIHQAPFSFSIIRHPWMVKPLHVSWAY